ncbi:MAG: hypothetical protein IT258_04140, partial [Saprospiraceae bacterium]|nr:hypothetical protein [Saprospiraceae bacterium]
MKSIVLVVLSLLCFLPTEQVFSQVDGKSQTLSGKSNAKDLKKKNMPKMRKFTNLELDNFPSYNGKDLGLTYTPKASTFKVWSP